MSSCFCTHTLLSVSVCVCSSCVLNSRVIIISLYSITFHSGFIKTKCPFFCCWCWRLFSTSKSQQWVWSCCLLTVQPCHCPECVSQIGLAAPSLSLPAFQMEKDVLDGKWCSYALKVCFHSNRSIDMRDISLRRMGVTVLFLVQPSIIEQQWLIHYGDKSCCNNEMPDKEWLPGWREEHTEAK